MALRLRGSRKQLCRHVILVSGFLIILVLVFGSFPHAAPEKSRVTNREQTRTGPGSLARERPRPITSPSQIVVDGPHNDAPRRSALSVAPGCEIWKDQGIEWERSLPMDRVPAKDPIPPTQLGTLNILDRHNPGGCMPAHNRFAPFGHMGAGAEYEDLPWNTVQWGGVQERCAVAHHKKAADGLRQEERALLKLKKPPANAEEVLQDDSADEKKTGRTAVVLRAWDQYEFGTNQKAWIRAMITELALDTAGQYQVFLLMDVKDHRWEDLLGDQALYNRYLEKIVPKEFQDMALLFNEMLLRDWYPRVSNHDAKYQMYQALQIFSYSFPDFDYVWQVELDARFTGHVGMMFEDAAKWAEKQPRRNLWERNARFYISDLWHDDYDAFSASVDQDLEDNGINGIWGPAPTAEQYLTPRGPLPPSDRSNATWGINEPPDLITFAPMIDPVGSSWTYEKEVHAFSASKSQNSALPRRMAMISMTRTSRRLLRLISSHQRSSGAWLVSESTPETYSLLHGFKAVFVPHLTSFNVGRDRLSPEQLDAMVHQGPVENSAGGKKAGFLWCGSFTKLPEKRWYAASYFWWPGQAIGFWFDYVQLGNCLPPLVLHPVKREAGVKLKAQEEGKKG